MLIQGVRRDVTKHSNNPETSTECREKRSRFSRRRIVGALLLVLVLCAVLWLVWHLWTTRGYREAAGTYIADGGRGYLVIEAQSFGRLRVKEGGVAFLTGGLSLDDTSDGAEVDVSVYYRGGRLRLAQEYRADGAMGAARLGMSASMFVDMESSATGDWDALACDVLTSYQTERDWWGRLVYLMGLCKRGEWADLREQIGYEWMRFTNPGLGSARMALRRPDKKVRSFLHRVDDARVVEVYRLLTESRHTSRTLALARELANDHPDDWQLGLLRIDREAWFGDLDHARRLFDAWLKRTNPQEWTLEWVAANLTQDILASAHVRRRMPGTVLGHTLFAKPFSGTGSVKPPASSFFAISGSTPPSKPRTLTEASAWFVRIADMESMPMRETFLVLPNMRTPDAWGETFQLDTDIARAVCDWSLLQVFAGNKEEAGKALAGLSQMISRLTFAERRMLFGKYGALVWGYLNAIQRTALLEGCATVQELDAVFATAKPLPSAQAGLRYRGCSYYPDSMIGALCDLFYPTRFGLRSPLWDELVSDSRLLQVQAEHVIMRAAAAARRCYMTTGKWPKSEADFAPLLSALPDDPCSTGTIGFRREGDGFVVYSAGEDGNLATMGNNYRLEVRPEREFPFPEGPVRADSAADVVALFPNGLPTDASREELAILDSTTTQPVVVFSPATFREGISRPYDQFWPENRVLRRGPPTPFEFYQLEPMWRPGMPDRTPADIYVELPGK